VAVVMLIPRTGPAWPIAFHRFAEVSIGIGVALILAAAWPEMVEVATVKKIVGKTGLGDRGHRGGASPAPTKEVERA
jgi:hypothetical protein